VIEADAIRFVVFGRAQGKGSKRALPIKRKAGGGAIVLVDSNKNAAPWARLVSDAAVQAVQRDGEIPPLIRGGVLVEMSFYFARPKGHYGSGRNAKRLRDSAPEYMTTMPDLDKLARCALDALTGVLIADDAQICELRLRKLYGEPERLAAVVYAFR
jgi:Holliday junction resolvase RusA-like endonuclease